MEHKRHLILDRDQLQHLKLREPIHLVKTLAHLKPKTNSNLVAPNNHSHNNNLNSDKQTIPLLQLTNLVLIDLRHLQDFSLILIGVLCNTRYRLQKSLILTKISKQPIPFREVLRQHPVLIQVQALTLNL